VGDSTRTIDIEGILSGQLQDDIGTQLGVHRHWDAVGDERQVRCSGPGASALDRVRLAITRGELRPYVQPVIDLRPGQCLLGAESLLRWQHPARGLLEAREFLHLVEEAELLAEVDLAAAQRLASDLSRLDRAGRRVERVWQNVSVGELLSDNFLETLAAVGGQAGLGGRIGLDVPAVVFSIDETSIRRQLALARRLGLALASDNFGREEWSAHFGMHVFETIKMDRWLVGHVDEGVASRCVLAAVIAFGHESGATVVAEGVERHSQLEALRDLGCDGAQGYLFGRPVQVMELLGFSALELPTCA